MKFFVTKKGKKVSQHLTFCDAPIKNTNLLKWAKIGLLQSVMDV